MSNSFNYFSNLKLAYADGSVWVYPYRNISSISFTNNRKEMTIQFFNGESVIVTSEKSTFDSISKKYDAWCEKMNSLVENGTFKPDYHENLNEQVQISLNEGMAKIFQQLGGIVNELHSKASEVNKIADTYIAITRGVGDDR